MAAAAISHRRVLYGHTERDTAAAFAAHDHYSAGLLLRKDLLRSLGTLQLGLTETQAMALVELCRSEKGLPAPPPPKMAPIRFNMAPEYYVGRA